MIKMLNNNLNESYKGINIEPFRPFSKTDWYSYAGAEKFSNGDQPLIYENDLMTVIIDNNGVEVNTGDVDDPITYYYDSTSFIKSIKLAKKVLSNKDMDLLDFSDFLESLGFTDI